MSAKEFRLGKLCVIGVGLIGGSLARALKRQSCCDEVVGYSRQEEHLKRAVELGVIDSFSTDLATAVKDADVVLVAVPIGAMQALFQQLATCISPNSIITDVGSAKVSVIAAAIKGFGVLPSRFVPGHPIAGTEKSGVEAAIDNLYCGRRVILTPTPNTDAQATTIVRTMWEIAGAEVLEMDAEQHDQVLAATSHLPHLLAFGLVDTLARMSTSDDIFRYAAGGFRDFTRIASSDPVMWRDICLGNSAAILTMIERFQTDLTALSDIVRRADAEALEALFTRAKSARDHFMRRFEPQ